MIPTLLLASMALADPDKDDEGKVQYRQRTEIDFEGFDVSGELAMPQGSYGATPGGAQDIAFFRDRVAAGEVPLPEVFTPEGLFSEHDLPLEAGPCERLLCANAKTVEARLGVQPDVRWLTQVGFDSGLSESTFQRAPLSLVAVIDKSCSMGGQPIETVRASLREVVGHLGPRDELSLVLYGADVQTLLPPTSASQRQVLERAIDAIAIDGSTNMEAGLERGFAIARERRRTFDGVTRLMLFTDERPNTGATDAASFMGMAEAASRDRIGMTTIGVGTQFGAELAQQVSAVRGGNLFFFPDMGAMKERFASDFDLMVTELAYDLELVVEASHGLRIAGVYGVPGDLVEWTGEGSMRLHVSTIFLSRNKGALYVAFAPQPGGTPVTTRFPGESVGGITLSYTPRDGVAEPHWMPLAVGTARPGDDGLRRGALLVDEITTLKRATTLHHQENDQDAAWQLVHALVARLEDAGDPSLAGEVELVRGLESTLARLAGRTGEGPRSERDPISGLPTARR